MPVESKRLATKEKNPLLFAKFLRKMLALFGARLLPSFLFIHMVLDSRVVCSSGDMASLEVFYNETRYSPKLCRNYCNLFLR